MNEEIEKLWTYEDLGKRWGLKARAVRDACKRLGLRPVDLGGKTKRFRPVAVMRAEENAEGGVRKRKSGALFEGI